MEEIKRFQPNGPCFIGGYCLGGTIALEIAQQLQQQGEEIGLLFMIENYNIKTIEWPLPLHLVAANKFLNTWYHVSNLVANNNDAKFELLAGKATTEFSRFKVSMQITLSSLLKHLGIANVADFPHTRIDKAYDSALADYQPKTFNGQIVLFGARKKLAGFSDRHYGWHGIAGQGIELHELPVMPRGSLAEPYVRMLAEKLRKCVDEKSACCSR